MFGLESSLHAELVPIFLPDVFSQSHELLVLKFMFIKIPVDLEGPILSKIYFFHSKFNTSTLSEISKKIMLKT